MDVWGEVWKRVWEIAFFGLKLGLDLEMRGHTPTKNSKEYPPRTYPLLTNLSNFPSCEDDDIFTYTNKLAV